MSAVSPHAASLWVDDATSMVRGPVRLEMALGHPKNVSTADGPAFRHGAFQLFR